MILQWTVVLIACGSAISAPQSPGAAREISEDVSFLLWTRSNPEDSNYYTLVYGNHGNVAASPLDPTSPTYIIIHGFSSSGTTDFILQGKTAILALDSYNVIGVDWHTLAAAPWYNIAVASVDKVGNFTATMLDWLHSDIGLDISKVHVIGHSLGAHLSGSIGRHLKSARLPRITGLDPAGPEFYNQPNENRLDPSDAEFVDVIHTNAGGILESCVGLKAPSGHVDFYPNGGDHQPGCVVLGEDWTDLLVGGCSHGRAHDYWVESISATDASQSFYSRPCDSWEAFQQGDCTDCGQGCLEMGFHLQAGATGGLYYLSTSNRSPFAQGN